MEKEDGIVICMNDKTQKNAFVRKSALSYLKRCVERSDKAGPRGSFSPENALEIAKLCVLKTTDSDATVRTEASSLLKAMMNHHDNEISNATIQVTRDLETSNPRLFKTLNAPGASISPSSPGRGQSTGTGKQLSNRGPSRPSNLPKSPRKATKNISVTAKRSTSVRPKPKLSSPKASSSSMTNSSNDFNVPPDEDSPELEDALSYLSSLNIPNWDAAEDEDGILLGLKSTEWKMRRDAINQLREFSGNEIAKSEFEKYPENVLVVVREHTKQFKDSNFNIVKAAIELFLAVFDSYEMHSVPLQFWITRCATRIAVEKISDKKFSMTALPLLTRLCEVQTPETIVILSIEVIESIKSPLPHEGLLSWTTGFIKDFGAVSLGKSLISCFNWVLKECANTNIKVRTAALKVVGEMHSQLGPMLKALLNSNTSVEDSVKTQVENKMNLSPMDPAVKTKTWPKRCLVLIKEASDGENAGGDEGNSLGIEIPRTDLVANLPPDCLTRMGLKENKDSWKRRKEALEEVESACIRFDGLISSDSSCFQSLVKLMRGLKARLSDSQSNLKPLAAKNIASILGSVDGAAQAKLGKIVYGPLIVAAMNDNKKLMRDTTLNALRKGTQKIELNGGGNNPLAMLPLMEAFATELIEVGQKAVGLPDVLAIIADLVTYFPKVDHSSKSKAKTGEALFAQSIIKCLISSQSDSRARAEEILKESIKSRVLNMSSLEKASAKLLAVEQRKVRPILDSLGSMPIEEIPSQQSPRKNMPRAASTIPFQKPKSSPGRPKSTVPFHHSGRDSPAQSIMSSSRSRAPSRTSQTKPNRRSVSRNRRDSTPGTKSVSDYSSAVSDLVTDPGFHPFKTESGISVSKAHRLNRQREHLPEYPEDPSGKDVLNNLKKTWSPLLPHPTSEVLFPTGGIKMQDDASSGCDLLCRGIDMLLESGEENILIEQIDLVIRWFACAFCSRDTTKGMQSMMSFLVKLAHLIKEADYELTDTESFMLLPYLLEKAGAAKGRFREMLPEIITSLMNDGIYPLDRYGSIICVSVIENTSTPKTRGLAVRECQMCVEKIGLNSLGKKGMQIVAKMYSEETLTENKTMFLDLIESAILKMNGDVKRFMKICGTNLSNKARESIEKRMLKNNNRNSSKSNNRESISRGSMAPTSQIKSHPKHDEVMKQFEITHNNNDFTDTNHNNMPLNRNHDEGPFKFSYRSSDGTSPRSRHQDGKNATEREESSALPNRFTTKRDANSGAAASLRERLRQIRDRHQPDMSPPSPPVNNITQSSIKGGSLSPTPPNQNSLLGSIMQDVDDLLAQPIPLGKNTDISSQALVGLRKLHSSLSNSSTDSTGTDPSVLIQLKKEVKSRISFCVFKLASVLDFGFRCGSPTHPTGISIPLISVSIAGLMAIFTAPEVSSNVSEAAVSVTIRQAASSLLDHRLNATSSSAAFGLDPTTCKKMVKAINKLAIQATHGVKKDISIPALLYLQVQFCTGAAEQNISISDFTNAHHRVSRIITKLFNRVLKSEVNEPLPFGGKTFDLDCVLERLEDALSKSQTQSTVAHSVAASDTSDLTDLDSMAGDKMAPCRNMCNSLMIELLKAKNAQGAATEVKVALRKLGYLTETFSGKLFISCCTELGLDSLVSPQKGPIGPISPVSVSSNKSYDVDQLSELIFAVGGAEEDDDRVDALEDLRDFVDKHPNINLESHVSGLSGPFRNYIMEQMKSPFRTPLRQSSRSLLSGYASSQGRPASTITTPGAAELNSEIMTMSQKLRYLKSKINAAEDSARSVIDTGTTVSTDIDVPIPPNSETTSPTFNNGFSTLRQRLAAASEKRSISLSPETSASSNGNQKPFESAALGNAAILRARLESVKRMNFSSVNS